MAETIHFTTIKRTKITVTDENDGSTWDLYDDVPMAIMAQFLALQNQMGDWQDSQEVGVLIAGMQASEPLINEIVLGIFQTQYPDFTEADVVAHFGYEERMLLGKLFFTHRSKRLSALSNASVPATSQVATTSHPVSTPKSMHSSKH